VIYLSFGLPCNSLDSGYLTATGHSRFEKHNVPLLVVVHMCCLSPKCLSVWDRREGITHRGA